MEAAPQHRAILQASLSHHQLEFCLGTPPQNMATLSRLSCNVCFSFNSLLNFLFYFIFGLVKGLYLHFFKPMHYFPVHCRLDIFLCY